MISITLAFSPSRHSVRSTLAHGVAPTLPGQGAAYRRAIKSSTGYALVLPLGRPYPVGSTPGSTFGHPILTSLSGAKDPLGEYHDLHQFPNWTVTTAAGLPVSPRPPSPPFLPMTFLAFKVRPFEVRNRKRLCYLLVFVVSVFI